MQNNNNKMYEIQKLIELQRSLIHHEKKRLGLVQDSEVQYDESEYEQQEQESYDETPNSYETSCQENSCKFQQYNCPQQFTEKQNLHLVEHLDLSRNEGTLEKEKQAFIDKLVNSENPLTFRSDDPINSAMLRYGEYSPNNPQLRVVAAPYIGLGEYEQRRPFLTKQRQADYQDHIARQTNFVKDKANHYFVEKKIALPACTLPSKSVQTDIQNINHKLVQYELHSQNPAEKELSPQPVHFLKSMNSNRNSALSRENALVNSEGNKPKSILSTRRTETPRERLMADLRHTYCPSFYDGFSYHDQADQSTKERIKREMYQAELRQQIEEKRRLQALHEEQERKEQDLENRRIEQQLLKMQEEEMQEDRRRYQRDDEFRRANEEFMKRRGELQANSYRKHRDSESSLTNINNVCTKKFSHYSPPVSRRLPYSFNIPSTSVFANPTSRYEPNYFQQDFSRGDTVHASTSRLGSLDRHDSLSRIDAMSRHDLLNRIDSLSVGSSRIQRRHSATQQDVNIVRRSPKAQRRNKYDDTLPIPVLKAHSPVAKELKNSVAIDSSRRSMDSVRKLDDKWQVPAVQKTIITHGDPLREGHNRSILTQLGTIRMQLQKEQLRMDECLRKRGFSQPKAV